MAFCSYYKNADVHGYIVHTQNLQLTNKVLPLNDSNADKLIHFECIKISLHWCIIIRISGFTHTLGYTNTLTEFREFF